VALEVRLEIFPPTLAAIVRSSEPRIKPLKELLVLSPQRFLYPA
jgi:hypothetical protein